MKKHLVIALAAAISATACNQLEKKTEMDLDNKSDKFSYCLGMDFATDIKNNGFDSLNIAAINAGIADVLSGSELKLTQQESQNFVREYLTELRTQNAAKKATEGAKFLEENAKREGVVSLPSGLQYEVITEGNGAKPTINDKVTTHYHGTLINGAVFDSSVERNEPASFPVGGVIAGWTEALQLMNVGSKWKLFIPSHLAYGDRGAGAMIGPGETLIFEVELLSIN